MYEEQRKIDASLAWCLLQVCQFWGKASLKLDFSAISNLIDPDILDSLHQAGWGVIQDGDLIHGRYPRVVQFANESYALLRLAQAQQLRLQTADLERLVSLDEWSKLTITGSWYIYPLGLIAEKAGLSAQLMSHLLKQIRGLQMMGLGIAVILVVYELFSLMEPILVNLLILKVDLFSSYTDIFWGLMGLALIFCFALVLGWFRQKLWLWLLGRISINLSSDLLLQLLYLPRELIDKASDAYARFLSLEQMVYRFLQQICFCALDALFLVIHFMAMLFFNWQLACWDLVFLFFFVGLSYRFTTSYYRQSCSALELQNQYAGYLLDSVRQLSMIQRSGIQSKVYARCYQVKQPYWQAYLDAEWSQNFFEWLLFLLRKLNTLGILAYGLWMIFNQKISLGGFLGFWTLKQQLFARLEILMKRALQWQYFKAPMDKLAEMFRQSSKQVLPFFRNAGLKQARIEVFSLQIRGIQYPNVSLQWGKHYWLHGPSGCGKTTFLMALMGNLPSTQGKIIYSGLRSKDMFSILHHDSLLKASLLDNITLFASDENQDLLWQVIHLVELEAVISALPFGMQTCLGEGGYSLSAGQVQRVLLARALYRQPKWLILDEATSHLDLATEAKLIQALLALPCSIIMVNHRCEYAKLFDEQIDLSFSHLRE